LTTQNNTYTSIIIGAGFSGIALAIKLKEQSIHDFVILEKADDVGGTWRENTYPGAECDIPSALYSFSFEPYPEWEYKWSMQPQILDYIKHVVKKYDLSKHIHFNQELVGARWDESSSVWEISTKSETSYKAKTFASAIGQPHHPSIPPFEGMDSFQGASFHSARWDHSVALNGKTVGVIGNAASAVQFIPEIAKTAGDVFIFQRSANWMLPKQDRAYKDWEKNLVKKLPFLLKLYRMKIFLLSGALFSLMKKGSDPMRSFYQNRSIKFINKYIKDQDLVQSLIPKYPLGAKRILFSDTYYPALARTNVHVAEGAIQKIKPDGVVGGDGTFRKLDVLVYATGFKTNPFLLGLDIVGRNGQNIREAWKNGPVNYMGMTTSGFPNMFMMYGPNTNLGHSSIILMIESQAAYITKCIKALQERDLSSMEVAKEAMEAYHNSTQERLKEMIWNSTKDSWYKSSSGELPNNYPGRTIEYKKKTKKVKFEEYIIKPIS